MDSPAPQRSRILVVDDNREIHADFRKLLAGDAAPSESERDGLDALDAIIGVDAEEVATEQIFDVDSADQGRKALLMVEAAVAEGRPYSLAFVDMRMPPGWDGLETIDHLVAVDPRMQIVICTAYSDHDWDDIHARVGHVDNVLVLKKPFDAIEARQMAWALCKKWSLARESERKQEELEASLDELRRESSRRRDVESRLAHDALHDVLTGLPNRALVTDRIQTALAACKRDPNRRVALAFIDLDEFKVVNDSLGHEAGDRMLVEIASRIVSSTRQTDCASRNTGNTVARLGGDEFLVLFDGVRRQEDAVFIAERIRENLSAPLVVEEHELRPSASIGLAHGGPEYDDAASLIRDADTALYRAKARGKAGVTVFDAELRREALARMRIETELRKAIGADQLFLEYQPIVSLDTLRTNGFEALVRWNHPEQGVVPPDDFIPLAEQTGLIFPLGEWVLRSTCRQVAEWRRRMPDAKRFFVNVNFSTRQLSMPSFVDDLLEILDESGIARDELHVEMTESVLLQNSGTAGRSLQRMSDEAIALHIDDFGTGFSSLSYLHKLPASAVKLDRSFLQGYIDGDTNEVTIRAIIDMAHARGLKVVAEGIETAEQLELLQRLGCDMGQGFYFARPLAVDVVERWIATQADTLAA